MDTNIITQVRIDALFGLYSYVLPRDTLFSNATILYGDNGVGKSTILRLVYHLLSGANDRGHRTALNTADFELLEVKLSSGIIFRAKPLEEEGIKFLRLDICEEEVILGRWDYISNRTRREFYDQDQHDYMLSNGKLIIKKSKRLKGKDKNSGIPLGEAIYLKVLQENAPNIFILNADRRLDSDTVADPSDEVELRHLMHYDSPKSVNELVQRSREIGLTQALSAASKWISQKAILGTNQGSTNVHSVYVDVVNRIASPIFINESAKGEQTIPDLVNKLKNIERKINEHAQYQLATPLSTESFIKILESDASEKSDLAAELLQPYIQSLERRLEAVEPIYRIIHIFVQAINAFLNDKKFDFKLGKGFKILNRFGTDLSASKLSSGEQQLLLLFCYAITARDESSIFMIDEPEISLNIKWQRQLIQALLEITEDSEIQFIFASHSMELLAQHRDRVVKLENLLDV